MDKGEDDMTGHILKGKIQKTRLFSDTEKIELLVRFEELSDNDRKVLEETIHEFDAKYTASVGMLRNDIQKWLIALNQDLSEEEKALMDDAESVTQLGLGLLT